MSWSSRLAAPLVAYLVLASPSSPASAQSQVELDDARRLFADALGDEQAGRPQAALEKFRRVQAVRDTPQVRFRVAACEEATGHFAAARASYLGAIELAGAERAHAHLIAVAQEHAASLSKRIGAIAVRGVSEPCGHVDVQIDGAKVSCEQAVGDAGIAVDPGKHLVLVSAPGSLPFRSEVLLTEGGVVTLTVTLVAAPPLGPLGPPAPVEPLLAITSTGPRALSSTSSSAARVEPTAASSDPRTVGWITLGGGAAFAVAGTILLAIREGDARTLQDACSGGVCPRSREAELQSAHDRAKLFGPLGVTFVAVGAVGLGVGGFLLLGTNGAPAVSRVRVRLHGTGLLLEGEY